MNQIHPAQVAHPVEFAAAEHAARTHYAALVAASPWIRDDLVRRCQRIVEDHAGVKSKLAKLRQLADEVAAAIAPHAICRQGCADCCHMMVTMAELEAQSIAAAVGRPVTGKGRPAQEAALDKPNLARRYFGVPCPFLKEGDCSIHEHRPIACRLHFSMADTPFFCRTDLKPDESAVPNVQMGAFWQAYALVTRQFPQGDIRDFFA